MLHTSELWVTLQTAPSSLSSLIKFPFDEGEPADTDVSQLPLPEPWSFPPQPRNHPRAWPLHQRDMHVWIGASPESLTITATSGPVCPSYRRGCQVWARHRWGWGGAVTWGLPHTTAPLGGEKRPRQPCLGGRGSGKLMVKKQNTNFKVKIMAQMVRICLQWGRPGIDPWVGKIPRRRNWQPTPGFLPGESHGQRTLAGYSPWGCKEADTTEAVNTFTSKKKGWGKLCENHNPIHRASWGPCSPGKSSPHTWCLTADPKTDATHLGWTDLFKGLPGGGAHTCTGGPPPGPHWMEQNRSS